MGEIIPMRAAKRGKAHGFEAVEVFINRVVHPNELWIAVGGPWAVNDRGARERIPWRHIATFPESDPASAARHAREVSAELGIPIVDLAGVLSDGPEAA